MACFYFIIYVLRKYERRFEGVLPLYAFNGFILLVPLCVINISTTHAHTHTCSHTAVGTKDVLLRVLSLLNINKIIVVSHNACSHCTQLTDRVHTNTRYKSINKICI